MKALVKVNWGKEVPELKLATANGYETIKLEKGLELEYEITDERRCVGFHYEKGVMTPCPEFNKIKSGDQCFNCRQKDIYSNWRTGNGTPGFEAGYSVYLAQIGDQVKVGVTRTNRLESRWREQGADYTVELFSEISPEEALEKEKELSRKGLKERVRKEHKVKNADIKLIKNRMDEIGLKGDIKDMSTSLNCKNVVRKGRFPSPVENVKGQLISNGRVCLAVTSGKVVRKPRQKGLAEF